MYMWRGFRLASAVSQFPRPEERFREKGQVCHQAGLGATHGTYARAAPRGPALAARFSGRSTATPARAILPLPPTHLP
eukprot:4380084-Prymnesium_polylepis.1